MIHIRQNIKRVTPDKVRVGDVIAFGLSGVNHNCVIEKITNNGRGYQFYWNNLTACEFYHNESFVWIGIGIVNENQIEAPKDYSH